MAEVEFRTGKREIPDYLADLMAGIKTQGMTYEEAVDAVNQRNVGQVLDRAMDRTIMGHFREHGMLKP